MKIGTYILATKYSDGDAHDHWAVGFLKGEFKVGSNIRYDVVDKDGNLFRHNGFRRIQKITAKEGEWIIKQGDAMKLADSVWHCLRWYRRQQKDS